MKIYLFRKESTGSRQRQIYTPFHVDRLRLNHLNCKELDIKVIQIMTDNNQLKWLTRSSRSSEKKVIHFIRPFGKNDSL